MAILNTKFWINFLQTFAEVSIPIENSKLEVYLQMELKNLGQGKFWKYWGLECFYIGSNGLKWFTWRYLIKSLTNVKNVVKFCRCFSQLSFHMLTLKALALLLRMNLFYRPLLRMNLFYRPVEGASMHMTQVKNILQLKEGWEYFKLCLTYRQTCKTKHSSQPVLCHFFFPQFH